MNTNLRKKGKQQCKIVMANLLHNKHFIPFNTAIKLI